MSITLQTSGTGSNYLDDTGNYTNPATATAPAAYYAPQLPLNLIPELITKNTIRFYPGAIADGNGVFMVFPTAIDVNFTTNGAAGLDTGSLVNNTRYYFYALKALTGETTIIGSTQISASLVTLPTSPVDYTGCYIAKIPMGLVYRTTYGFPDFRIQGWCSKFPKFIYSDIDTTGWKFISAGVATGFTSVSLYTGANVWVPENSRLVTIKGTITSTTGAGNLSTMLDAGSTYQKVQATVKAGGVASFEFDQVITSSGSFKWQSPANTTTDMWISGYSMSEA